MIEIRSAVIRLRRRSRGAVARLFGRERKVKVAPELRARARANLARGYLQLRREPVLASQVGVEAEHAVPEPGETPENLERALLARPLLLQMLLEHLRRPRGGVLEEDVARAVVAQESLRSPQRHRLVPFDVELHHRNGGGAAQVRLHRPRFHHRVEGAGLHPLPRARSVRRVARGEETVADVGVDGGRLDAKLRRSAGVAARNRGAHHMHALANGAVRRECQ
mmetsp:Transcript_12514/g.41268  ORF Transcript_12514/g.41268 Transcript_12514/m.41268 type:complete len:223 (-) Transcript_12514:845-1513(-)